MRTSTRLAITCLVLALALNVSDVFTNQSAPPTGRTGAPGEQTCNASGCHNSSALQTNSSQILMQSISPANIFTQGYTPGVTYNMAITLSMSAPRFGFEATCLDLNNNFVGDLTAIQSTTTGTTTNSGREYLHHKSASSTNAWAFTWQAPAAGTDSVTFYVAANAANANNSTSGDVIYTKSFKVSERPSGCDDVFFSEYIEGLAFNRAIELYNPTASPINLNNYVMALYKNGAVIASDTYTFSSSDIIPAYGTYVVAHPVADTAILNRANLADTIILFNGDDAFALYNANGDTLDVFGVIGQDPGSSWPGSLGGQSIDYTLVRKPQYRQGTESNPSSFDPDEEWFAYPTVWPFGFWDSLGTHNNVCKPNFCSGFDVATTLNPISCNGASDGSLSFTFAGGSGEYRIMGNTTNLAAGSYSVSITDTIIGCQFAVNGLITEPDPITTVMNGDSTSCGANNDGKAWVTASGGTPPYMYTWNLPILASVDTVSGLMSGWYFVTVNDANGCTAVDSIEIFDRAFPTQPASITGPETVCLFSNATYYVSAMPDETYTWIHSGGGTLAQSGDSAAVEWNLVAGNYTITVVGSNSCGASPAKTKTVTVVAAPLKPTILGDTSVCIDATNLYSVQTQAGNTVNWSLNSGGTLTPSGVDAAVAWSNGGSHALIVDISNQCGNAGDTLNIVGNGIPVSLGADTVACDSVTLWPDQVFLNGYVWNTGAVGIPQTVYQSGTYSLTVTDFAGCETADTIEVIIAGPPVASFTESILGNGTVELTNTTISSIPYTSQWTFIVGNNEAIDTSTLENPTYFASQSGVLIILVTENACGTDTTTYNLAGEGINEAPWADAVDIYPVPTSGNLFIEWPQQKGSMQISVINLIGKTVNVSTTEALNGKQTIDVSTLPAGMYLLQLQHQTGTVLKKVLVE